MNYGYTHVFTETLRAYAERLIRRRGAVPHRGGYTDIVGGAGVQLSRPWPRELELRVDSLCFRYRFVEAWSGECTARLIEVRVEDPGDDCPGSLAQLRHYWKQLKKIENGIKDFCGEK